ncbi:MAG: sensor domain-containing diguanylate cyclase [Candidatus Omnitrophota bacterium]|nr:sensor domain-containing diguanylate cyclase [Candidatus Omnitrophota bacterium]
MTHPSNRSILGVLSIISLTLSIYVLANQSFEIDPSSPFRVNLLITTISSYNIAILFGWLAFGVPMGVTITILSILIVIWADLRAGMNGYSALTFQFYITAFFGYSLSKAKSGIINVNTLKLEKIGEEKNLIINSVKEKERNIRVLKEKLDRYAIFREVVETMSTRLSVDDIVALAIEKAARILGKGGRTLFFLVDTEKQGLMLAASEGSERVMTKTGDIFDHWVLRNRKSLIVEDVTMDFRFSTENIEASTNIFRSLIETPLVVEDKVIGMLRLDSVDALKYSQDDLRLLDIIADLSAVSIQNARLYSKTEDLSRKDGVTGLVVRRYFLERFEEEVRRAAINNGMLSILILDIDHFKNYNDKYGHAAGDLVLRHLAKTLDALVREGDIVARYGGEEMILLLCGRGKKEANLAAEEIRKTVKNKPLVLRRHTANITVSIGLAAYPEDAMREEELIKIADKRLYKAKDGGRDRVCQA